MNKIIFFIFTVSVFACGGNDRSGAIYVKDGYAVGGYDVVAYFEQNGPVRGDEKFSYEWGGSTWLFASEDHLESFRNDPEKFAPQYGGYCAWGCSNGYKATTEPDAWTIVEGKLYLNYNTDVKADWMKNQAELIKQADKNWSEIKNK